MPAINFYPDRQVLHDRSDLMVEIVDFQEIPSQFQLKVFYNNRDMTEKFMEQSRLEKNHDTKSVKFVFEDLRLRPSDTNKIRVEYRKDQDHKFSANYEPPSCALAEARTIASITGFEPPDEYVNWIGKTSLEAGINPGIVAGVVAQESGFNPRAVSWAKAIGLTQITPVAEQEIISQHSEFPRYPGINELSYLKLKSKILSGEINENKEWRLNPRHSIQGGISYINYLRTYWELPQNQEVLTKLSGDARVNMAKVILASYNSGAARVKSAIVTQGDQWYLQENLKEARKYVNRVSSFCYHFSKKAKSNDNET